MAFPSPLAQLSIYDSSSSIEGVLGPPVRRFASSDVAGEARCSVLESALQGPLSGLRIVNLSSTLVGAFAGQVLSDFGAEHILVEPPGGHPMRSQPGWPVLARGSRSIEIDLGDRSAAASVVALAQSADVVVE